MKIRARLGRAIHRGTRGPGRAPYQRPRGCGQAFAHPSICHAVLSLVVLSWPQSEAGRTRKTDKIAPRGGIWRFIIDSDSAESFGGFMKTLLLVLGFSLISAALAQQSQQSPVQAPAGAPLEAKKGGAVEGRVINSKTGEPVRRVSLTLRPSNTPGGAGAGMVMGPIAPA